MVDNGLMVNGTSLSNEEYMVNWWLMEHDMVIYRAKVMFNAKNITVLLRLICI